MTSSHWQKVKKQRRQNRNSELVTKSQQRWIRKRGRLPGQRWRDVIHERYHRQEKWHTEKVIESIFAPFIRLDPLARERLCEGTDLALLIEFWMNWLEGLAHVLDLRHYNELLLERVNLNPNEFCTACDNLNSATDIVDILVHLLRDIQEGNQNTLLKFAKRKVGRSPDPKVIREFKSSIGLQYRLLRDVFLLPKEKAVKLLIHATRRQEITIHVDDVTEWDKFDTAEFDDMARSMMRSILAYFEIMLKMYVYEYSSFKDIIKKAPMNEVKKTWRREARHKLPELQFMSHQNRRIIRKIWVLHIRSVLAFNSHYPVIRDLKLYQKWNQLSLKSGQTD